MKATPPVGYWPFMAVAGAVGGLLFAWGAPAAPPGRLLLICLAMGCAVAVISHVLLWRSQPFGLRRALTALWFFAWWGVIAEALSPWFSKR